MASTALSKLYAHANNATAALRRMRAKERESKNEFVERAGEGLAIIAGGALAGAIDGKWGHDNKPDTEKNGIAQVGPVPINAGAGLVLVAVGMTGMLPGSDYMSAFGASMLAYPIAKTIEAKMQEQKA